MPDDTLAPERDLALADARAPRGVTLLSVASSLPETVVGNDEVAERIGKSDEWIYTRTGIRTRRHARPEERLSDFAAAAGRLALQRAGVEAADLDLVLVGTMTADEITPNAAPLVAQALGATRAGAFDVGAACTAFLSALAVGTAQIEAGRAEHVLVVGADFISRILDHASKATAMLFGDGAGAVVLAPREGASRIGPILLRADGSQPEVLTCGYEPRHIQMDGHETFKHAVANMAEITREAVAAADLTLDDIDLFVYHQANGRILRAVAERLELEPDRVVDCIDGTGNMSAATLPYALDVAQRDGRLHDGARVLLSAFGAGFTWGGAVIEWGNDDA